MSQILWTFEHPVISTVPSSKTFTTIAVDTHLGRSRDRCVGYCISKEVQGDVLQPRFVPQISPCIQGCKYGVAINRANRNTEHGIEHFRRHDVQLSAGSGTTCVLDTDGPYKNGRQ